MFTKLIKVVKDILSLNKIPIFAPLVYNNTNTGADENIKKLYNKRYHKPM